MAAVEIEENKIMEKGMQDLDSLSRQMGMPVKQENGQRRFGPPSDCKSVPPKGCEVFVGKIPRDCYETELVPVFEKVGKIYEVRLMMDFNGANRGYCFVQYFTTAQAQAACKELNHYEIRKGRTIGVVKSVDNCRLFIGGIPKDKTEQEILDEVSRVTDGVVKVIVYPSVMDKTKNRGFAFIEYESHRAAAMARRKMIPGKTPLWGVSICVDWAEPEPDVDPEIINKVQILYVRNLMMSTTEETLSVLFNAVSDNGVERVKKIKDYAFIHFATRDKAENAKVAMHGKEIEGSCADVSWAKPVDKNVHKAQKALSRSLYSPGALTNGSAYTPHFSYINNLSQGVLDGGGHYALMSHHPAVNQMDGIHYMTPQVQMIPGYTVNNNVPIRNSRNRDNRNRTAAGVQGMRLPISSQNILASQSPFSNVENAYDFSLYIANTQGMVQQQLYYPSYSQSTLIPSNTNAQPHYG